MKHLLPHLVKRTTQALSGWAKRDVRKRSTPRRRLQLRALEDRIALSTIGYQDIRLVDLNGNGVSEAVGRVASTGAWWASSFDSDTQSFTQQELAAWDPNGTYANVMVGNVDGNGRPDIVGLDTRTGNWWGLLWNGTQWVGQTLVQWDASTSYADVRLADVNGDGRQEIVGRSVRDGTWLAVGFDGTDFSTFTLARWNPRLNYTPAMAFDVTGDGHIDLVARDLSSGSWYEVGWDGTGYSSGVFARWNPAVSYTSPIVADINHDGRLDIIARDLTYGTWWALTSTATGFTNQAIAHWNPALTYTNPIPADVNGDGQMDFVARDVTNGTWWAVTSNGHGYSNRVIAQWNPAPNYSSPIAADINGDGQLDFVAQDLTYGTWWAVASTPHGYTNQLIASWNPTLSYQNIRLADLNGDHQADIFGTLASTGTWWSILSTPQGAEQMRVANSNSDWWYTPTATSGTDDDLRQQIVNEVPGLSSLLGSQPLEAARLVLDWAANAVDSSNSTVVVTALTNTVTVRTASDLYYNVFQPNGGGGWCGAMAVFGSKVLRLFGYNTFTINFGDTNHDLTHVSVVLAWQGRYYLYDPTFNLTFRNASNGQPLDLFTVMDLVNHGNVAAVQVVKGSLDQRMYLMTSRAIAPPFVYRSTGSFYQFGLPDYSVDDFMASFPVGGYSADLTGFMDLLEHRVFAVDTSTDIQASTNFVNQLTARGIPLGAG